MSSGEKVQRVAVSGNALQRSEAAADMQIILDGRLRLIEVTAVVLR
jgi:hypothetical protein